MINSEKYFARIDAYRIEQNGVLLPKRAFQKISPTALSHGFLGKLCASDRIERNEVDHARFSG